MTIAELKAPLFYPPLMFVKCSVIEYSPQLQKKILEQANVKKSNFSIFHGNAGHGKKHNKEQKNAKLQTSDVVEKFLWITGC